MIIGARTLAGLLLALGISLILMYLAGPSLVPDSDSISASYKDESVIDSWILRITIAESLFALLAFAVGGYVARKDFLISALVLETALLAHGIWSGITRSLEVSKQAEIQINTGEVSDFLADYVLQMLPNFAIVLLAAGAGAILGMRLSRLRGTLNNRALNERNQSTK